MCFRWFTDCALTACCIVAVASALLYLLHFSTDLWHSVGEFTHSQSSAAWDYVRPYAINQSKAAANALIEQALQ